MNGNYNSGHNHFSQQIADEVHSMARAQGVEFDEASLCERAETAGENGPEHSSRGTVLATFLGALTVVVHKLGNTLL